MRYRYDTGNIIDQEKGELLTEIQVRNRLNQQDTLIKTQKQDINELTQLNNQYYNKMTTSQKEIKNIKNTIKNLMENERTRLGYNSLKQAYEAIK